MFTAIKNALSLRDEIYEFIKTKPPKTIVGKLNASDASRHDIRRVGKRISQTLFNGRYFSSLARCLQVNCG